MRFATVLALTLLLTGCGGGGSDPTGPGGGGGGGGGTNHAPTVSINTNTTHLAYGGQATITVSATDVDGDQLAYNYTAAAGTISSSGPTATSATFTAGSQWGAASVTVTVSDGKGGQAQATASMYVRRPDLPHICIRPGTGCGNVYKVALYPGEALIVTDMALNPYGAGQCSLFKHYGTAGLSLAAWTEHSFDDIPCPTCPADPTNSTWYVTVTGHRPEPDGGDFVVTLGPWNPANATSTPCN